MNSYLAHREKEIWPAAEELRDVRPDAARKRLHECKDQSNACEAIREIVSNLLGCEEMALFQVDRKHGRLSLIWSFGIQPNALHLPQRLSDSALSSVIAGETHIDAGSAAPHIVIHSHTASAFVPIHFKGKTAGMLALLRLLPQKTKIDDLDRGLLAVISSEAGKPLFGARSKGPARRGKKR